MRANFRQQVYHSDMEYKLLCLCKEGEGGAPQLVGGKELSSRAQTGDLRPGAWFRSLSLN